MALDMFSSRFFDYTIYFGISTTMIRNEQRIRPLLNSTLLFHEVIKRRAEKFQIKGAVIKRWKILIRFPFFRFLVARPMCIQMALEISVV